MSVSKQRGS